MSRCESVQDGVAASKAFDRPILPSVFDDTAVSCATRLSAAFDELLKSFEYAAHLNMSVWEFAVDLPSLRRLAIGKNDLRWLVAAGFVRHSIETTTNVNSERTFRSSGKLRFKRRTCFVLTEKGIQVAKVLSDRVPSIGEAAAECGASFDLQPTPPSPKWDRQRQELLVGKMIVKRFRVPAPSQEVILAAFEEECWPARIDDPLPPRGDQCPKRRLQETIKSLNRNQRYPLLRFLGDGNARGVVWEFIGHANGEGSSGAAGKASSFPEDGR